MSRRAEARMAQVHPFPADKLRRLAGLVLEGDVVFFVGAGFSLDSERNTPGRLVTRLLIRLLALAEHLGTEGARIRDSLANTFDLSIAGADLTTAPAFPYPKKDVDKLSEKYFETNDWFCTAFGDLLRVGVRSAADRGPERERYLERLIESVRTTSERIRLAPGGERNGPLDSVSFTPPSEPLPAQRDLLPELIAWAGREGDDAARLAGKALFLDTMGFRDSRIMAGDPGAPDLETVGTSFGRRLLPRHHVIARLAREGLCTTTVTTNFDLLFEGAFRLAGFRYRSGKAPVTPLPHALFSEFAPITRATEFFSEGKAHRTAVLVKMHGCDHTYRDIVPTGSSDAIAIEALRAYLPSMVFTYREIQNWRTDSWAADFLRTLLRTRTVVLTGYSLQDPVVHDTFRTVYEEMGRVRTTSDRADPSRSSPDPAGPGSIAGGGTVPSMTGAERAPAYYLGMMEAGKEHQVPFHGLEVLQSACDAVGVPRADRDDHPNFIRFWKRSDPGFPNLDETLQWLFHLVFRLRQKECVATALQRTLTVLHGRPRPEVELQRARSLFRHLCRLEMAAAARWISDPASRRQHARISSWTQSFHPGLLRQFATIDLIRHCGRVDETVARLGSLGWYHPATQDAGWTCWGAVVELAIRRMARAALPCLPVSESSQGAAGETVWAGAGHEPTVLLRRHGGAPQTAAHALVIQPMDAAPGRVRTRLHGCPGSECFWILRDQDAPWRRSAWRSAAGTPGGGRDALIEDLQETAHRRDAATLVRRAPPAYLVWRWASMTETPDERKAAASWLGLDPAPGAGTLDERDRPGSLVQRSDLDFALTPRPSPL